MLLTHDTDLLVTLGPTRRRLTGVDIIHRQDGRVVHVDSDERRHTTKGLLLTEERAIKRSLTRHHEDRVAVALRWTELEFDRARLIIRQTVTMQVYAHALEGDDATAIFGDR